jgi:hypothetical protein
MFNVPAKGANGAKPVGRLSLDRSGGDHALVCRARFFAIA